MVLQDGEAPRPEEEGPSEAWRSERVPNDPPRRERRPRARAWRVHVRRGWAGNGARTDQFRAGEIHIWLTVRQAARGDGAARLGAGRDGGAR